MSLSSAIIVALLAAASYGCKVRFIYDHVQKGGISYRHYNSKWGSVHSKFITITQFSSPEEHYSGDGYVFVA